MTRTKVCLHCKTEKTIEEFPVDKRRSDGRRSHCNECNVKLAMTYQSENLQGHRDRTRKYRYGLTAVEFEQMVINQDGVCAICLKLPKGDKVLSVDHCHQTEKVRELLCGTCNSILGFASEDAELLQRAIEYLKRHHSD